MFGNIFTVKFYYENGFLNDWSWTLWAVWLKKHFEVYSLE